MRNWCLLLYTWKEAATAVLELVEHAGSVSSFCHFVLWCASLFFLFFDMPLDLSFGEMLPDAFVVEVEIILYAELALVLEVLLLDVLIGISNRVHPHFLVVFETG